MADDVEFSGTTRPVRFIRLGTRNVRFIKLPPRPAPAPRAPRTTDEEVEFFAVTRPPNPLPPPTPPPFEQRFKCSILAHADYSASDKKRKDSGPEAYCEVIGTTDEIELIRGTLIGFMGRFIKKRQVAGIADDIIPVPDSESRYIDSGVLFNNRKHQAESRNLLDTIRQNFGGR